MRAKTDRRDSGSVCGRQDGGVGRWRDVGGDGGYKWDQARMYGVTAAFCNGSECDY